MLGKKTKRKFHLSNKGIKKNSNKPKKDSKNKKVKKWFKYYNNYPEDYIMTGRDANILSIRLKSFSSQGILKSEKKAFYNFIEYLKKSPNPKRADEFQDIYSALKEGVIKTVDNTKNDLSIKEESEIDDSFLDVARENEIILSKSNINKKADAKIDNFLVNSTKHTIDSEIKNNDKKSKNDKSKDNKIKENKEIFQTSNGYGEKLVNNSIKDKMIKKKEDNLIINESIKCKNKILENNKDKKNITKSKKFIRIKKKKTNINDFIQKEENDGDNKVISHEEKDSKTIKPNLKKKKIKGYNGHNSTNSQKEQLGGLKNIENKNITNEDEIFEIDENLIQEKNLNFPNKLSKKEITNEEEKRDQNIEEDKKDLPVLNREGQIISKEVIKDYVSNENLNMLKNLVFPLYNYRTFEFNFGKLKYKNWIKLHIKCQYCNKNIYLKYHTYDEHLVKFHFKVMSEKDLVNELKQKKIFQKLFIKEFIKYKKKENDLLAIDLYYRTLKGKTYGKSTQLAEEYMKTFKKFKSISVGKARDILDERMKSIITQRNTTKKKGKET